MTCLRIPGGIICLVPFYRLRLEDGRYVFMEWHSYLGPCFYKDKNQCRMIDDWYEDPLTCKALDWFVGRGKKA